MRFSSATIIKVAAGTTATILAATSLVLFKPNLLAGLGSAELSNLSNFGQFVSGVFAPIAFVWLAIAVLLQSRELELQREELRLTRDEMKQSRQVFDLQKDEMKRAADDAREQTAIMSKNLERDAEAQIHSEVDLLLYSTSLYLAANYNRSRVNFHNGDGFYLLDASDIAPKLDRNNYDRIFIVLRSALENATQRLRSQGQVRFEAVPGCREFFEYCFETFQKLTTEQKYAQNQLALARIRGLQIPESMSLMHNLKTNLFGG